jgi:UDP-N-acetylmuramyl pentapeptide phosphotransferase/UDP-N-acetylglucosamine-1-phosphate transferase
MNSITNTVTSLKWGSIAFAVLWTGWMIWWSGDFAAVNIIILTICGAVAGYLWYRLMCWRFRRMSMLSDESSSGPTAK